MHCFEAIGRDANGAQRGKSRAAQDPFGLVLESMEFPDVFRIADLDRSEVGQLLLGQLAELRIGLDQVGLFEMAATAPDMDVENNADQVVRGCVDDLRHYLLLK